MQNPKSRGHELGHPSSGAPPFKSLHTLIAVLKDTSVSWRISHTNCNLWLQIFQESREIWLCLAVQQLGKNCQRDVPLASSSEFCGMFRLFLFLRMHFYSAMNAENQVDNRV